MKRLRNTIKSHLAGVRSGCPIFRLLAMTTIQLTTFSSPAPKRQDASSCTYVKVWWKRGDSLWKSHLRDCRRRHVSLRLLVWTKVTCSFNLNVAGIDDATLIRPALVIGPPIPRTPPNHVTTSILETYRWLLEYQREIICLGLDRTLSATFQPLTAFDHVDNVDTVRNDRVEVGSKWPSWVLWFAVWDPACSGRSWTCALCSRWSTQPTSLVIWSHVQLGGVGCGGPPGLRRWSSWLFSRHPHRLDWAGIEVVQFRAEGPLPVWDSLGRLNWDYLIQYVFLPCFAPHRLWSLSARLVNKNWVQLAGSSISSPIMEVDAYSGPWTDHSPL